MKMTTLLVLAGAGFLVWQMLNDGKQTKQNAKVAVKGNPKIQWGSYVDEYETRPLTYSYPDYTKAMQ